MSLKIIVASENPVKIACARDGFTRMFPDVPFHIMGIASQSGVPDQPMSREETITGAKNRALFAAKAHPDADYTMGIEGGLALYNGQFEVFAWIVVRSRSGRIGMAQTGIFYLPDEVAQFVHQGMELGHADDAVFGRHNSKQNTGSVGILTDDVLTRTSFYVNAVIMALIPFKQPHLTWQTS